MKHYYIEYMGYCDGDYEECGSKIIEARSKKAAIKQLSKDVESDNFTEIEIGTIYQTSSDARP